MIYPNGSESSFFAKKAPKEGGDDKKNGGMRGGGKAKDVKVMPVTYPNGAYGFAQLPKQETILFRNATVWTNESDGILENTDVLIKNGKIAAIGQKPECQWSQGGRRYRKTPDSRYY